MVEGARLEIAYSALNRIVGSNPTRSARFPPRRFLWREERPLLTTGSWLPVVPTLRPPAGVAAGLPLRSGPDARITRRTVTHPAAGT